jgi:bacteriocin-like protein
MKMMELNENELSAVSGGHGHGRGEGKGQDKGGLGINVSPVTQVNESVIVQIMLGSGTQTASVGQGATNGLTA